MKHPVPAQRTGLAEWQVEIGNGVQDLFAGKLFSRNVAFREMQGNVLNGYETLFSLCVGFKADWTLKMEIGNEVFSAF